MCLTTQPSHTLQALRVVSARAAGAAATTISSTAPGSHRKHPPDRSGLKQKVAIAITKKGAEPAKHGGWQTVHQQIVSTKAKQTLTL